MAKNLIGKNWVESSSGNILEILNPATGEVIDTVPESNEKDANEAVEAAILGQKKWAKRTLHERGKILMKFAELVEKNKDELADQEKQENQSKKQLEKLQTYK